MELDELKNLWKQDSLKLDNTLKVNEKLLLDMKMDKVNEFEKVVKKSIWGRNLALVFASFSFLNGIVLFDELIYSVPSFLAGFALIWSFIDHLSIERKNFYKLPLIDLQKAISKFRIHTAETAKYDISIALFWQITIIPVFFKTVFKIDVYSNAKYLTIFFLILVALIAIFIASNLNIYKKQLVQLKEVEDYLDELMEFTKEE